MVKIWKDKNGKWIDRKEFMSRWKSGINKVTPLQQVKSQLIFSMITLIGIVCGIVVSIIAIKTLWWLGIILLAAFGNTIIGVIGLYQKYIQLDKINKVMIQIKEVNKDGF
jgi:hypothetical protein